MVMSLWVVWDLKTCPRCGLCYCASHQLCCFAFPRALSTRSLLNVEALQSSIDKLSHLFFHCLVVLNKTYHIATLLHLTLGQSGIYCAMLWHAIPSGGHNSAPLT